MKRLFGWCPLKPPDMCLKARLPLGRWADRGAVVFLGCGIGQVLFGLDEGWSQFFPLALGMLLFGLPHGAIDHLVALGLAGRPLKVGPLCVVLALYLVLVVGVLALWAVLPIAAASCFLLVTIYHWGKSDVAFERFCWPTTPGFRRPLGEGIHIVVRGLIPIGVPFVAFPGQVGEFLNACLSLKAPDSDFPVGLWSPFMLVLLALFFLADLGLNLWHFRHAAARRILLENTALALFFTCVPPLVAIGWYFAGWHGLRHILRLSAYLAQSQAGEGSLRVGLSRFVWQAFPLTLAAILMLCLLFWWMADRGTSPLERAALYMILISALTLPHLILVEWMDYCEGKNSRADW